MEHVLKLAETLAPNRDAILNEREQTHGSFPQNASMWDDMLLSLHNAKFQKAEHRLALSMICLKIARAAQHPECTDHWEDIAGYAKLAAEACSK
jgi:hypothetical protein